MKGDLAQAQRLLERAESTDSNIDLVHFYLGMTYFKQGKKIEACQQFRMSEAAGDDKVTPEFTSQCASIK
ncbi:hypothetical protein D3C83_163210 [compost metagenome]